MLSNKDNTAPFPQLASFCCYCEKVFLHTASNLDSRTPIRTHNQLVMTGVKSSLAHTSVSLQGLLPYCTTRSYPNAFIFYLRRICAGPGMYSTQRRFLAAFLGSQPYKCLIHICVCGWPDAFCPRKKIFSSGTGLKMCSVYVRVFCDDVYAPSRAQVSSTACPQSAWQTYWRPCVPRHRRCLESSWEDETAIYIPILTTFPPFHSSRCNRNKGCATMSTKVGVSKHIPEVDSALLGRAWPVAGQWWYPNLWYPMTEGRALVIQVHMSTTVHPRSITIGYRSYSLESLREVLGTPTVSVPCLVQLVCCAGFLRSRGGCWPLGNGVF